MPGIGIWRRRSALCPRPSALALAKLMSRHTFMIVNTFKISETLKIYDC